MPKPNSQGSKKRQGDEVTQITKRSKKQIEYGDVFKLFDDGNALKSLQDKETTFTLDALFNVIAEVKKAELSKEIKENILLLAMGKIEPALSQPLGFRHGTTSENLSDLIKNLERLDKDYQVPSFSIAATVKIIEIMLSQKDVSAYVLTKMLSYSGFALSPVADQGIREQLLARSIPAQLLNQVVETVVKLDPDYKALKGFIMGISLLNEKNRIAGELKAENFQGIFSQVKHSRYNTIITSALCELLKNLNEKKRLSGQISVYRINGCLKHFNLDKVNRHGKDQYGIKSISYIFHNLNCLSGNHKESSDNNEESSNPNRLTDILEMSDCVHVLKEFLRFSIYDKHIGSYLYSLSMLSQKHILGRISSTHLLRCLEKTAEHADSLGLALYSMGVLSGKGHILGKMDIDVIYSYFVKQQNLKNMSQALQGMGLMSRDKMLLGILPAEPLVNFIRPLLQGVDAHSYVSIIVNLQELFKMNNLTGELPVDLVCILFNNLAYDCTQKQLGVALTYFSELVMHKRIEPWNGSQLFQYMMSFCNHLDHSLDRSACITIFTALVSMARYYPVFNELFSPFAKKILATNVMEIEDALEFLNVLSWITAKDERYCPYFLQTLNLIPHFQNLDKVHQDELKLIVKNLQGMPDFFHSVNIHLGLEEPHSPTPSLARTPSPARTPTPIQTPSPPPSIPTEALADDEQFYRDDDEGGIIEEGEIIEFEDGEIEPSTRTASRDNVFASKRHAPVTASVNLPDSLVYERIYYLDKQALYGLLGIPLDREYMLVFKRRKLKQSGMRNNDIGQNAYTDRERLVARFFDLDQTQLSELIRNSRNADYFLALFDACSMGIRFRLARDTNCIPLIVRHLNPAKQLEKFVLILTHNFQFYRDYKAFSQLNNELTARREKNPSEATLLLNLQEIILRRACKNHRTHHLVLPQIIIELDKLPEPPSSVSNQVSTAGNQASSARNQASFFQSTQRSRPTQKPIPSIRRIVSPRPEESFSAGPITARVRVNCQYLYETEDIQAILVERIEYLRLKTTSIPEIHVFAAAKLSSTGNNIADILFNHIQHESLDYCRTLLIPVQDRNHWVGLRVDVHHGAIATITYFDSNRGSDYNPEDDLRLKAIDKQLRDNNLFAPTGITIPERCLQQSDLSSCGAMLIENFYFDLKGEWRAQDPSETEIRKLHLATLFAFRPDYYETFARRQQSGVSSIDDVEDSNSPSF